MGLNDDGANNAASAQPEPDYAELFKEFVTQSVQATLEEIPDSALFLDEEVRQRVMHVLSYALSLVEAWPDTSKLLLKIASQMEKAGHRDDWIPYLRRGTQLSETARDTLTSANLHIQLGFLYQLRNRLEEADYCYHFSTLYFAALGDFSNQARALNQQAFVAWMQGNTEKAKQLANTALKLLPKTDVHQATGFVTLGWLAFDRQDLAMADSYFTQALTLWEIHGDKRQIARRLRELANVRQLQGHDEESIAYYERAIALFKELNDMFEQAVTEMNLGIFFLRHRSVEEAIELFRGAESIFRHFNDEMHLAINANNLGIAYREAKQFDYAISVLEKGIAHCHLLNRIDWLVDMIDELGMTQLAAGNPFKAYKLFQQAQLHLQSAEKQLTYPHLTETIATHLQLVSSQIS